LLVALKDNVSSKNTQTKIFSYNRNIKLTLLVVS